MYPGSDGLGDTGISFIDTLVNQGKGLIQNQVQRVTERVADFKLLARTHRALRARLQSLASSPKVKSDATLAKNVSTLLGNLTITEGSWNLANNQLDALLSQVQSFSTASLNASVLSSAASVLTGMTDSFKKTKAIEDSVKALESVSLSPEQQAAAQKLGAVAPVVSLPLLAVLAGGGYLFFRSMKK
jgi:hypothetical protein